MSFEFLGIRIRIDFTFVLMIFLFLLKNQDGMASAICTAVFLHETGHLIMLRLLRTEICEIRFAIPAISILLRQNQRLGPWKDIGINLSGILMNLFAAAAFLLPGQFCSPIDSAANLTLAGVQLLPLPGMDGGDILRILLSLTQGEESAARTAAGFGRICAAAGAVGMTAAVFCTESKIAAAAGAAFFLWIFFLPHD